ncbi:hypothetical protein [Natrialba aegyptia]|uniref:Uncharacterized protein n=1 Tax=Natrialba aegyptia DSM 13077 TaxID=1227491 RepID=M0ATV4_9EURY|nr:hypothetical protein [Natrialba aegyptia]ELZ02131.1 hypothetical protein C480_17402 [Natrialba aegyptia DSM 13077]
MTDGTGPEYSTNTAGGTEKSRNDTVSTDAARTAVTFETNDSADGDQGSQLEHDTVDDRRVPTDGLHEALRNAERDLREIDEQLPSPLTFNDSLTELRATADAYARLEPSHCNSGD